MSPHRHLQLGPAAIAAGPRPPSRPLDLEPLSKEHSRLAWVLGSGLFRESSQPRWLSANPQPNLFSPRDQIFSVTNAAGRSESSDSSLCERSSSNCIVLRLSSLTI